jgi:uncharacterized membrane protein
VFLGVFAMFTFASVSATALTYREALPAPDRRFGNRLFRRFQGLVILGTAATVASGLGLFVAFIAFCLDAVRFFSAY